MTSPDIWARIAAPVAPESIAWRQDGRPVTRDNKTVARFVAYIEANTVRERLDAVVPGEWDLTLELLPPLAALEGGEEAPPCAFKARLQILGVIREDVGSGKDFKQASTDAFKRAAVRFGIGHELYAYEQNWVELDGDGKYAKPVEDPSKVYARRMGRVGSTGHVGAAAVRQDAPASPASSPAPASADEGEPSCPVCSGRMWDNRASKKNSKAPDYKCRDRSCDGIIWPPKPGQTAKPNGKQAVSIGDAPWLDDEPPQDRVAFTDDIPW